MKNRRQCRRRQLLFHLPIVEVDSGVKLGYLVNITAEGIQLVSESEFAIGKTMHIRVEGVVGCFEGQTIVMDVVSRWCKCDANGRTWVIGCSISDENGRDVADIIELMYNSTF